jgi:hypothetical protein
MNEEQKKEVLNKVRVAMDNLSRQLDQLEEREQLPTGMPAFESLRVAFDSYPDMVLAVLDNGALIQGALADIGHETFLNYANIMGFVQLLASQNMIPKKVLPGMLTEIMKYCVLQGIEYGRGLNEYDNNLFADFVNDLDNELE